MTTGYDIKRDLHKYHDSGCEFADSCLNCPFAQCLLDEPRGKQHWLMALRAKEIIRLYISGLNQDKIAEKYGVSTRTIQRALAR